MEEALATPFWAPGADSRKIGYARVSTEEQNLDMQIAALTAEGVEADYVFTEKVSATSKKRPALQAAIEQCRSGDVFVVWRFDRVARSLKQLLDILQNLTDRGVGFLSLQERVDTTIPVGRLYVHMAGALAEFERCLIVERTRAGVKRAKERGVKFGAEMKLDVAKAETLLREGASPREVAKRLGVARQTVYNHFPMQERERLARIGPKRKRKK